MNKKIINTVLTVLGVFASCAVMAQAYPNKPIRIVIPNAPGGGTDVVARMLSESLQADLGQPILIENNKDRNKYNISDYKEI